MRDKRNSKNDVTPGHHRDALPGLRAGKGRGGAHLHQDHGPLRGHVHGRPAGLGAFESRAVVTKVIQSLAEMN